MTKRQDNGHTVIQNWMQSPLKGSPPISPLTMFPTESVRHRSLANAVVTPKDYGLGDFAASSLLPLVGLAGQEAIRGRLYVTNLRVAFVAHAFNRLQGTISIPLTKIEAYGRWNSLLSIGVTVSTAVASHRFITWSRSRVLASIEAAQRTFGSREEEVLAHLADQVERDMRSRPGAEGVNLAATALFALGGQPAAFDIIGLLNHRRREKKAYP